MFSSRRDAIFSNRSAYSHGKMAIRKNVFASCPGETLISAAQSAYSHGKTLIVREASFAFPMGVLPWENASCLLEKYVWPRRDANLIWGICVSSKQNV